MDNPDHEANSLQARAKRRVDMKIGLYVHALVYVLVNLGLYVLNASTGGYRWSHWPLLGWGLGLAIHAVVTVVSLRGEGMRERMLAREVEHLRQRDKG